VHRAQPLPAQVAKLKSIVETLELAPGSGHVQLVKKAGRKSS
jgi:hypothetical protein